MYHSLKSVLKKQGLATGLGDEGGFAPDVAGTKAALDLISSAIEGAGFKLGSDVALALDVAATEFYTDGTGYAFEKETRTAEQMTSSTPDCSTPTRWCRSRTRCPRTTGTAGWR